MTPPNVQPESDLTARRPTFAPTARWLWVAGGLLALAGALASVDGTLSHWLGTLAVDPSPQRFIIKQSYRVFKWYTYVALVVLLLTYPNPRRTLTGLGAAVGISLALIYPLKFLVGRARPQAELGPWAFQPLRLIDDSFDSFPSGHVGGALVVALLVSCYFPRWRWVFIPLATLVGLGRIVQDRHFVTDTLVAAAIALISVYLAARLIGRDAFQPLQRSPRSAAASGGADREAEPA